MKPFVNLPRTGIAALLLLGACTSAAPRPAPAPPAPVPIPVPAPAPAPTVGLPPIPAADGPLAIRVIHPLSGSARPGVDSTYVYGSVGTGRAALTINGTPVQVAPNGAFLAYLPVPLSGYELRARSDAAETSATVAYRPPPATRPAAAPAPTTETYAPTRSGVVTGGADTLATGSDVAVARPTPTGTYRWFLPRGARLEITGRRAEQYRVRLDTATAWIDAGELRVDSAAAPSGGAAALGATLTALPAAEWIDYRVAANHAPFHVDPQPDRLVVTVYGRAAIGAPPAEGDPLVAGVDWGGTAPARLEIRLARPLWGYRAFYDAAGALVVRVRRPPAIDPAAPLRGLRIVVDPGHPPAGATGPMGMTEAEANLAIGLRVAERLRAAGAEPILTRDANVASSTTQRVDLAVAADADLLLSIHNNAFAEGVNPFRNNGTSTYYFHPFSAALARVLVGEIAAVTRIPNQGARWSNLALTRPTWMPAALTESLYMLIPEQEAALRDSAFLDRLAEAHVRGGETFVRETAR